MEVLKNSETGSSNDGGFITGVFVFGLLLSFLGLVSGIAGLVYQLFFWLKNGSWVHLPLAFFLKKINMDLTSIYSPTDWSGLAKLIQWFIELHVGGALLIPGIFLLFMFFVLIRIYY